jgi:lysophospholipase L1-like esterase
MYSTDPYTIFRMKARARERSVLTGGLEWSWTTNSVGFRGTREYASPKPRDIRRVLVLGDSFTFGFGVNDAQTYSAVLEELLNSACEGYRVQVINAGVSGFSTSQELILLERDGPALQPDAVVVGFFINDPQDNIDKSVHSIDGDSLVRDGGAASAYSGVSRVKRVVNAIPGYEWLARNSMLVNALRRVYFASRAQSPSEHPPRWGMDYASDTPVDSSAVKTQWRLTELLYARIRDQADAMRSALVVALLPDDSTALRYAAGRSQAAESFARMRGVCGRVGLLCVDVGTSIGALGDVTQIARLYLVGEGHFSAEGHRLTALTLAPALANVLGCASRLGR